MYKHDEKYLDLAKFFAGWSKDPSTGVGAVAIGEHPNQSVRIIESLPDRDDFRTVLLEDGYFFLAKALVQGVDVTAPRGVGGVHSELKAAGALTDVLREFGRQLTFGAAGVGWALGLGGACEAEANGDT